jgi:hypothetical protein
MKQLTRANILIIIGLALALCFPLVRYLDKPKVEEEPKVPVIEQKAVAEQPQKKEFNTMALYNMRQNLQKMVRNGQWSGWNTEFGDSGDVKLFNEDQLEVTFNITAVTIEVIDNNIQAKCNSCIITKGGDQTVRVNTIPICSNDEVALALLNKYKAAVKEKLLGE